MFAPVFVCRRGWKINIYKHKELPVYDRCEHVRSQERANSYSV